MPLTEPSVRPLPTGILRRHIKRAAADIEREGVPGRHQSRSFDVFVDGKRYPAKHLVRLAATLVSGKSPDPFHAHTAIKLLRELGYEVIDCKQSAEDAIASEDDESAFPEGRERYRLHRELERDPSISKTAKEKRLGATGKLECDVCGFNFTSVYGKLGKGFIEAHHQTPVSRLDGKTKTKVADLALVCSNCHRMLHRGNLAIVELRKLLGP